MQFQLVLAYLVTLLRNYRWSWLRQHSCAAPSSELQPGTPPSTQLLLLQLNDTLSLGLHRVWKRMAVGWSGAAPGHAALDVCCGSGDLALRLAETVGSDGSVSHMDSCRACCSL